MGLDFQLRGRQISLEISAQNSIPSAGYIRPTAPLELSRAGSAAQGARAGRGCLRRPQEPLANNLARIYSHGAPPSVSFRNGRWAHAEVELFFGADESHISCTTVAETLERSADGRTFPAAIHTRRADELCRDVDGKGSGKFELYGFLGIAGVLRPTMRTENDSHVKVVS